MRFVVDILTFAVPITLIYFIIRLCLIKKYRIFGKERFLKYLLFYIFLH